MENEKTPLEQAKIKIDAEAGVIRQEALLGAAAAQLSIDQSEKSEMARLREKYAARRSKLDKKLQKVISMSNIDLWHKYRVVGSVEGWLLQYRQMAADGEPD
jgi:hypothetical protein